MQDLRLSWAWRRNPRAVSQAPPSPANRPGPSSPSRFCRVERPTVGHADNAAYHAAIVFNHSFGCDGPVSMLVSGPVPVLFAIHTEAVPLPGSGALLTAGPGVTGLLLRRRRTSA